MSRPQESYSQWIRAVIGKTRGPRDDIVRLFDSSVPEPRELLRRAVVATVEPEFSGQYVSAFGDGNPFVRETLARRYGVDRAQILCTTGATAALSLIYRAFLGQGDHVLVETPGFDLFAGLADAQGVAVDMFQRRGDHFVVDVAEVEQRLQPRTRLVILTNLHNPSGMAIDHGTLADLAALAERRGFLLVVDEVYGDYAAPQVRPVAAAALSPAVVSVSSLTKIFGLASLRCGWIVAAPAVVERLRDLNARVEFGVSSLTHAVSAQILADPAPFSDYSRACVERSRRLFDPWFTHMTADGLMAGALPEAGCIAFPALPGIADTRAFSEWLIEQSGVIVAPGEYFGAPGRIRIGFCQDALVLERGLSALEDGLRRYRAG